MLGKKLNLEGHFWEVFFMQLRYTQFERQVARQLRGQLQDQISWKLYVDFSNVWKSNPILAQIF